MSSNSRTSGIRNIRRRRGRTTTRSSKPSSGNSSQSRTTSTSRRGRTTGRGRGRGRRRKVRKTKINRMKNEHPVPPKRGNRLMVSGDPKKCEVRIAYFVPKKTKKTIEAFKMFTERLGKNFYVLEVYKRHLVNGWLDKYFFSGTGPRHAEALGDDGRKIVLEYLKKGHGFFGICAGAYLGTFPLEYTESWNFGLSRFKIMDLDHWNRGKTDFCKIEYTEGPIGGKRNLITKDKNIMYRYANGPLFKLEESKEKLGDADQYLGPPIVFAHFRSDIVKKKGFPRGVMINTPAIVGNEYYEGRVLLSSGHPEKSALKYSNHLRNLVRWVCKKETRV